MIALDLLLRYLLFKGAGVFFGATSIIKCRPLFAPTPLKGLSENDLARGNTANYSMPYFLPREVYGKNRLTHWPKATRRNLLKLTDYFCSKLVVMQTSELVVLYRPVGPKELELIQLSGWTKFPPRLPDQPIFYPVRNEDYAVQIARDWNVPASGVGYVTKFSVLKDYACKFQIQNVGAELHDELWVPAEELEEFNSNIIGIIEVTKTFR